MRYACRISEAVTNLPDMLNVGTGGADSISRRFPFGVPSLASTDFTVSTKVSNIGQNAAEILRRTQTMRDRLLQGDIPFMETEFLPSLVGGVRPISGRDHRLPHEERMQEDIRSRVIRDQHGQLGKHVDTQRRHHNGTGVHQGREPCRGLNPAHVGEPIQFLPDSRRDEILRRRRKSQPDPKSVQNEIADLPDGLAILDSRGRENDDQFAFVADSHPAAGPAGE